MNAWEAGLSTPLISFFKNPADIQAIQEIYRCFSADERIQRAMESHLLANKSFRDLYEQWYTPNEFTLEQLEKLPSGSFGSVYAGHMKKNGLKLDFISDFKNRNILSYLWHRAKHVHDITHLIVGYDTSVLGEAGVKGFEFAQYLSPATAAILGGGIVSVSLLQPQALGPMMDTVIEGFLKGKSYPLLMAIKWDNEWETPFYELLAKYRLPRPVDQPGC